MVELGLFVWALIMIALLVLMVLAFLLPYFVYRISRNTDIMRQQLAALNKQVKQLNDSSGVWPAQVQ